MGRALNLDDIIPDFDNSPEVNKTNFMSLFRTITFGDDSRMKIYSIDEDMYIEHVLSVVFDDRGISSEKLKIKKRIIVDLDNIIYSSKLTKELTRTILEKVILSTLMDQSYYMSFLIDKSIFTTAEWVSDSMFYEIIDGVIMDGIVTGSDIAYFINREELCDYIKNFLIAKTATILKESFQGMEVSFNNNMLFLLGWVENKLQFLEVEVFIEM